MELDIEDYVNIAFNVFMAAAIIYLIFGFKDTMEHKLFMNTYVGKQYIYRQDTITILEYDFGGDRFIIDKHGTINENIIYRLKEVK